MRRFFLRIFCIRKISKKEGVSPIIRGMTEMAENKQPKTIFGTTEKSNFILNMKQETLQTWIAALLAAVVAVPQITGFLVYGLKASQSLLAAGVYFTGFACILFFIIAMIKHIADFKEDKILWLVVFMAVWAVASYYGVVLRAESDAGSQSAELINTALSGELGRYEGLLSLLAYLGIFCLALCVRRIKTVQLTADIIICAGVVQSVLAVFQHIPGLDFMPNFADLPTLALRDVMLSSGLSENPIVFGSFLTITFSAAFVLSVYEKNILRARLYGAAAMLFWLVGFFTSSIVPIIGMCSAFVLVTVLIFAGKKVKFESGLLKSSVYRYAAAAVGMAVIFVIVWLAQGIYIRDKAIAYYDSFFRLFITVSYSVVNDSSLYGIGLEKSFALLKEHPILGVGPDLMAKYQIMDPDLQLCSIDKSYCEPVYIAVTRGIPALLGYIVFLAASVKRSIIGILSGDPAKIAVFAAIGSYIIQSFFSFSSVLCAPIFWMLCGFAFAKIKE